MHIFPFEYQTPVFRPPSESQSLLFQVTLGCSHNKCTYCDMYRSKQYKVRSLVDIFREIEASKRYFDLQGFVPSKIFLCDGDALGAPMDILLPVLDKINDLYPKIRRVGIYATAENILAKTPEELRQLSQRKLSMAYLGLESGSDEIAHMIVKGNSQAQMIEASLRIKEAGFKLSTIAMLGVGGRKFSDIHVRDTAMVLSKTSPEFFSFLTTMAIPGTPYYKMVEREIIEMLTTRELLLEMKGILTEIKPLSNSIIFRANHVSNQFPLAGVLPKDNQKIIKVLDEWILETPPGVYPPMPSSM